MTRLHLHRYAVKFIVEFRGLRLRFSSHFIYFSQTEFPVFETKFRFSILDRFKLYLSRQNLHTRTRREGTFRLTEILSL